MHGPSPWAPPRQRPPHPHPRLRAPSRGQRRQSRASPAPAPKAPAPAPKAPALKAKAPQATAAPKAAAAPAPAGQGQLRSYAADLALVSTVMGGIDFEELSVVAEKLRASYGNLGMRMAVLAEHSQLCTSIAFLGQP